MTEHQHYNHHFTKEKPLLWVIAITFFVMVGEMVTGYFTHSMALFAEGAHMVSHILVLGISWCTYFAIRKFIPADRTDISVKRVIDLSAFVSGLILLVMALGIIVESVLRLLRPEVTVDYGSALVLAVVGLLTNAVCAFILHGGHDDLNSRAAYLHIVADVLTDFAAILGLLCGMVWHVNSVDAIAALVGGGVVLRWAVRLLVSTAKDIVRTDGGKQEG